MSYNNNSTYSTGTCKIILFKNTFGILTAAEFVIKSDSEKDRQLLHMHMLRYLVFSDQVCSFPCLFLWILMVLFV